MFPIGMDANAPPDPASGRLPSGRHELPRAFVESNQRERILNAVMVAVRDRGYSAMRIEDVIAIAGVSRRTFYDHFGNKEDAFLAAYDQVVRQLTKEVELAFRGTDAWPRRVSRALASFLTQLADEPALAHVCIVEVLAAGPSALARRAAALQRFQAFVDPRRSEGGPPLVVSPLAVETVIGGIYEVVYSRVVEQRTDELPGLLPGLLYAVLLPFVGDEVATAEAALVGPDS
jgi:AcrR family transcriptional regulator